MLGAHTGYIWKYLEQANTRYLWRVFAISFPLLHKHDRMSHQRNAFWPINSRVVSLVQTHCRPSALENNNKKQEPSWKMLSSFLEKCYVNLLPELLVKGKISVFISPQRDMCVTVWVQRIESKDKHLFQIVCLLQSQGIGFHDSPKEFSLKNVIHTVANVWNDADILTFSKGWHRFCLHWCFKNEPAVPGWYGSMVDCLPMH